ncbi:hypothetical protein B9M32_25490 [Salmonella enterica]|nr:hypothetical protein CHE19_27010 [Salmonella enterica]EBF6936465.1 hypothetical protein [Salmonella enterica subsp. enterica serovar Concord]EAU4234077.1 hypothetical protein [Salmonella enterica]EBF7062813.1 hypothetical protein [Salmonella enterica subsp. enterica serovar Concord]EBF7254712.1 hypothetical protein [Salmonella enterica]
MVGCGVPVALFNFLNESCHIDEVDGFPFADLLNHHLYRFAFASGNSRGAGRKGRCRQTLLFVSEYGVLADGVAAMRIITAYLHFGTAKRIAVVSGDGRDFRKICSCGHITNRSLVLT